MLYDDVGYLSNLTTIYLLIAIPKKKKIWQVKQS